MDMETPNTPATLQEAIVFFSDPGNCHAFMVSLRWPDGRVVCPRCGSPDVKYGCSGSSASGTYHDDSRFASNVESTARAVYSRASILALCKGVGGVASVRD
jgi:hypothetical protein